MLFPWTKILSWQNRRSFQEHNVHVDRRRVGACCSQFKHSKQCAVWVVIDFYPKVTGKTVYNYVSPHKQINEYQFKWTLQSKSDEKCDILTASDTSYIGTSQTRCPVGLYGILVWKY